MKDTESKGVNPPLESVPKGAGSGTPRVLPTLPGADLKSDGEWFAEQVGIKYPDSTKSAKKRLLADLHKTLPPKSRVGRPPRADVTEALRLESEGCHRTEIYRRLGKNCREEQRALREAVRQRKSRRRKSTELALLTCSGVDDHSFQ
jgi:hypothetical protein